MFGVRFQPGPRRPWRTLTWGDLGMHFDSTEPFAVPTVEQAEMAVEAVTQRGAKAKIEEQP